MTKALVFATMAPTVNTGATLVQVITEAKEVCRVTGQQMMNVEFNGFTLYISASTDVEAVVARFHDTLSNYVAAQNRTYVLR